MKNPNISRWFVTIVIFVITYILSGTLLHYILTSDIKFFSLGSEMKYGIGTWSLIFLHSSEIFTSPGWEGVVVLFGILSLISVITLLFFSYWITGRFFKDRNTQLK